MPLPLPQSQRSRSYYLEPDPKISRIGLASTFIDVEPTAHDLPSFLLESYVLHLPWYFRHGHDREHHVLVVQCRGSHWERIGTGTTSTLLEASPVKKSWMDIRLGWPRLCVSPPLTTVKSVPATTFSWQDLLLVECTHAILRLTLVLRKVCQCLFALSYDSLTYPFTPRLYAHVERLRSHVQTVTCRCQYFTYWSLSSMHLRVIKYVDRNGLPILI